MKRLSRYRRRGKTASDEAGGGRARYARRGFGGISETSGLAET